MSCHLAAAANETSSWIFLCICLHDLNFDQWPTSKHLLFNQQHSILYILHACFTLCVFTQKNVLPNQITKLHHYIKKSQKRAFLYFHLKACHSTCDTGVLFPGGTYHTPSTQIYHLPVIQVSCHLSPINPHPHQVYHWLVIQVTLGGSYHSPHQVYHLVVIEVLYPLVAEITLHNDCILLTHYMNYKRSWTDN